MKKWYPQSIRVKKQQNKQMESGFAPQLLTFVKYKTKSTHEHIDVINNQNDQGNKDDCNDREGDDTAMI